MRTVIEFLVISRKISQVYIRAGLAWLEDSFFVKICLKCEYANEEIKVGIS